MSACFCRLAFDMIRKLAYYDETFLASTHQNSQWSCNLDPNLSKLANLNPKWPERTVMCFKIAWFDQTSSSWDLKLGTSSKFDSGRLELYAKNRFQVQMRNCQPVSFVCYNQKFNVDKSKLNLISRFSWLSCMDKDNIDWVPVQSYHPLFNSNCPFCLYILFCISDSFKNIMT